MEVGYTRNSEKDQNPDLRRRDLVAAGCERFFEEQISSRKEDRPELGAALEYVRDGEALVVWKLDRFGRCSKRGRRLYPRSAKRWRPEDDAIPLRGARRHAAGSKVGVESRSGR